MEVLQHVRNQSLKLSKEKYSKKNKAIFPPIKVDQITNSIRFIRFNVCENYFIIDEQ